MARCSRIVSRTATPAHDGESPVHHERARPTRRTRAPMSAPRFRFLLGLVTALVDAGQVSFDTETSDSLLAHPWSNSSATARTA